MSENKYMNLRTKVLVWFKYKVELIQLKMRFFNLQYQVLLIPI